MDLGHDTATALTRVVALVNTSPTASATEGLPGLPALVAHLRRFGIRDVDPPSEADLPAVHRLRASFHQVFLATDDVRAVRHINAILRSGRMEPRLTNHDGHAWHIHYFEPGAPLVEHLAAEGGMALALVLAAGERERLRSCEAPGCRRVLVDLSRNRSRRYCDSRTCGNRLHVAAYRARRREAARVRDTSAPDLPGPRVVHAERSGVELPDPDMTR